MIKKMSLLALLSVVYAFINIDPEIQAILNSLAKFRENQPQEKVYLHTDKPFYSIGDTIYFKAYLANAANNSPSTLSRILYVDLTNEQNAIVSSVQLQVTNGIAHGVIPLEESMQEGNYRVRAYTNWMRNFDNAFFFYRIIPVGNALDNDLLMTASFKVDSTTKKNLATINYISLQNTGVAAMEVSYSILQNSKEIATNKGSTNQAGEIVFTLPEMPGKALYELVTAVRTGGKNTLSTRTKIELPGRHYGINFFPESGQLVNGLSSVVSVEVLDQQGNGMHLSGDVVNEKGDKVAAFTTGFAGIGSFSFTPLQGHDYTAVLKYPDGKEEKYKLPKAADEGYIMAVDHTNSDDLTVRVMEKGTASKEIILVVQSNNAAIIAQKLSVVNGSAVFVIPKIKLPTGINHFTLFDAARKPIAERLVFIDHHDNLQISLTPGTGVSNKPGNISMVLEVKDAFGDPVDGSFSASVTNGNLIPIKNNETTIVSSFLLEADLKGYVADPGYYFTDNSASKIKELDNLMLTKRWQKFAWKDILTGNYSPVSYKAENSLAISGRVVAPDGKAVPHAKLTLLSKTGEGFILDTVANGEGEFIFDRLNFSGEMLFAIKAVAADGNDNVFVKLNETVPPDTSSRAYAHDLNYAGKAPMIHYLKSSSARFNEMRKQGLLNRKEITLKEVTVKTKEQDKVAEAVAPSANLNGPGQADQVLTYLDLPNCNDLSICLFGKIRGVNFRSVLVKGTMLFIPYANTGMNKPMLVVVDGQPMNTLDGSFSLMSLPAGDIQSIEVLRTAGYMAPYGLMGSGGVLVITTKHGDIDYHGLDAKKKLNSKPPKGMIFFKLKGFSTSPQFPGDSNPAAKSIIDAVGTIYWKPDIVTDEEGRAIIEFPGSTVSGNYNIVIEGISVEGKLGSARFTFR